MRVIKFRAWDKYDKVLRRVADMNFSQWWLAVGELRPETTSGFEAGDEHDFDDNDDRCNRFIIEQFTGLKDSKGTEIYEGDIVSYDSIWCEGDETDPHVSNGIGPVIYDEKTASYVVVGNMMLAEVVLQDRYEVIGNVHENPESLEGLTNGKSN